MQTSKSKSALHLVLALLSSHNISIAEPAAQGASIIGPGALSCAIWTLDHQVYSSTNPNVAIEDGWLLGFASGRFPELIQILNSGGMTGDRLSSLIIAGLTLQCALSPGETIVLAAEESLAAAEYHASHSPAR